MTPLLLYLHGFNSSPQSAKANDLQAYLDRMQAPIELQVPQLHHHPEVAIAQASEILDQAVETGRPFGLMGSSLGGFYAAWLSSRFDCPAVLVNPAVYPYRLLADYVGPQENPYTGERYMLTEAHRAVLQRFDVGCAFLPARLLVLLETRDETLDYREALNRYPGASTWVRPGGSHAFEGFRACLPASLTFLFGRSHFPGL